MDKEKWIEARLRDRIGSNGLSEHWNVLGHVHGERSYSTWSKKFMCKREAQSSDVARLHTTVETTNVGPGNPVTGNWEESRFPSWEAQRPQ